MRASTHATANPAGLVYFRFFRLAILGWLILAFVCFNSTLRLARNHEGVRYPVTVCLAFLPMPAVSCEIIAPSTQGSWQSVQSVPREPAARGDESHNVEKHTTRSSCPVPGGVLLSEGVKLPDGEVMHARRAQGKRPKRRCQ